MTAEISGACTLFGAHQGHTEVLKESIDRPTGYLGPNGSVVFCFLVGGCLCGFLAGF